MKYDFTTILDRHGKDAAAVDISPYDVKTKEGFDNIPMWVADMNFGTAPSVLKAINKRLEHTTFGYFLPRDEYYDSIIHWHEKQFGIQGLTRECIGYENGVHGGNCAALRVFCSRGDHVLLNTPAYASFIRNLKALGYNASLSPMHCDEQDIWRMDFEDMEKRIVEENIHAMIFCSPHNPTGRVWERWEIEKVVSLCEKHDVMILSDEIWADLVLDGRRHIPTQSVNEEARKRTIAMYSPTKAFNLAGLVGSYHVVYNKTLRDRMGQESMLTHYNNVNVLSMYALIGAYDPDGEEWLNELRQVLSENVQFAHEFITEHFEGIKVSRPQGTYMLFLDCTKWCGAHNTTLDELLLKGAEVGVIWQDGRPFGGEQHIRMNLALPTSRVKEAFDRLNQYVFYGGM